MAALRKLSALPLAPPDKCLVRSWQTPPTRTPLNICSAHTLILTERSVTLAQTFSLTPCSVLGLEVYLSHLIKCRGTN